MTFPLERFLGKSNVPPKKLNMTNMTNMATQTSMNEWMYFLVEMVDFPAIVMYFLLEGIHYINFNFQTPKIDETQCNSSRWRMIMSKKKNL